MVEKQPRGHKPTRSHAIEGSPTGRRGPQMPYPAFPRVTFGRFRLLAILSGWLLLATGCNFSPPVKEKAEAKSGAQQQQTQDQNPGWDLDCIYARLQNPPESFHYSYKHNDTAWEAEVTASTIDGTRTDPQGVQPIHGVRSDTDSWRGAWMKLSAISGMSSTFALVHNADEATVREAAESLNGYDTIRYSVDTTRATSVESGLYRTTLGAGGFEKGTVWVTSKGCPVKFVLDVEMHLRDGSVAHDHYEEAMIRR